MSRFWKKICALGLVLAPISSGLTGCGFFPKITTCTTNCTTSTNYMYVANSATTAASVAGFSLTTVTTAATATTAATSTLTLAVTPSSPYSLGFVPTAMAITPGNKYMYVGSLTAGIYLYAINSNGSLTVQNNGKPVAADIPTSMKVDSTGSWLIVSDLNTATTKAVINVYSIASSTGLLGSTPGTIAGSHVGAANRVAISPNNANVYVTLGTGGIDAFTFNATAGSLTFVGNVSPSTTLSVDKAVTTDTGSAFVFVTETASAGLRVFQIGTSPALTEISTSPYQTGAGPSAVVVDATNSYVYVTNQTDSTISEFTLTPKTGALAEVANSPITTGSTPVDIVEDSTKTYVGVACQGGNKDLEIYSFDATTAGALDSAGSATTGTDPTLAVAIAATN